MELAIAQARRRNGRLGVLFLDLDHFKRINDTLGHSVGDELLRQVADRLVRTLRESDLVSRLGDDESESTVSRLGGDEFTLLLAELRDPRDLAAVASRLLAALRQPFEVRNHELVIGASIGIASWPADGETLDALLSNADSAMYHAKANGRNGYQFYDQSMNAAALRRLNIEARLRRALEHDELALHYQPRIELTSGRITGFEALLRWTDAELGAVPPGEFIPISEQTGLIEALGEWVMRTVCEEVCRWEREIGPLGLRVSLNVSARQFGPELSRKLARILAETGVNPVRVELEITESAILRDEAGVIQTLHELRGMGLAIALDDFGTGYSSLSHLRRLPVDTLKIDQSFVKPIAQSNEAAALTRSIVAMGKALGLRVVAEGVETDRQRALLAEWSCDEIQGFVICRAEPADEALARLRADRGLA
jgi:diguanylate cyclase (GGDEF)-like protein